MIHKPIYYPAMNHETDPLVKRFNPSPFAPNVPPSGIQKPQRIADWKAVFGEDYPKIIKTQAEYEHALSRLNVIFDAEPYTPDGDEAELLSALIGMYEDEIYPI